MKRIFLDYASGEGNPSAIYDEGVEAKKKLEDARTRIARVLHAQAREIIFTSGGTESDNLAMLGVFEASKKRFPKPHVIISNLEHPAIVECAKEIERRGGEVTITTADNILSAVKDNTVLVSVSYAGSDTGAIQPIAKIARGLNGPYLHSDATQAARYLPVDVSALGVDMLTLDASKIGGPKGQGLLIVRSRVQINPIMFGGGQERGLRPGTENVEAIVEFANALEKVQKNRDKESKKVQEIKDLFLERLKTNLPFAIINTPEDSLPNIVSVSFPNQLHEFLAIKLNEKGVNVSTGSSCKSLKSIDESEAIRFSFGPQTTKAEVEKCIRILKEVVV